MVDREVTELQSALDACKKDVESKTATIKHLQNALDAKSMTIGILSKANREGGDIEAHITNAVRAKIDAAVKSKGDEILALQTKLEEAEKKAKNSAANETVKLEMQKAHEREKAELQVEIQKAFEEERKRVTEAHTKEKAELQKEIVQACEVEKSKALDELRTDFMAAFDEERDRMMNLHETEKAELQRDFKEAFDAEKASTDAVIHQLREESRKAQAGHKSEAVARKAVEDAAVTTVGEVQEKLRVAEEALERARDDAAASFQESLDAARALLEEAVGEADQLRIELEEKEKELAEVKSQAEKELAEAKAQAEKMNQQPVAGKPTDNYSELSLDIMIYRSRTIELQASNEALGQQVQYLTDEMQQMQADSQEEIEALQKEVQTFQNDRQTQWRLATEQIDSRVELMRRANEAEKAGLLTETAEVREQERQRLLELTAEVDKLRVKCDAQDLELKGLREAAGMEEGDVVEDGLGETDGDGETAQESAAELRRAPSKDKARALQVQCKFAFDEMWTRISEIRAETEMEKKKIEADFEQKLKERAANIVQLTNQVDSLETQTEALERAKDALMDQRDQLNSREREHLRNAAQAESRIEEVREEYKGMTQRVAVGQMAFVLHRSAVAPAFSMLRQALPASRLTRDEVGVELDETFEDDCQASSQFDASTTDGDLTNIIEEEEEDEEEEEEEEEDYGVDEEGHEEWIEMMRANTLNALFTGIGAVTSNVKQAAEDLNDHVSNITGSLEIFPQMNAALLTVLDRVGKGKELREFIDIMTRAMGRCQRLSSVITELSDRSSDAAGGLQELVRVKLLEQQLRSLRTAGQHDLLVKLLKNQMVKYRSEWEDVLDQFGEHCEEISRLKEELEIAKAEIAKAEAAKAETAKAETANTETEKVETAKAETPTVDPAPKQRASSGSPAADAGRPKATSIVLPSNGATSIGDIQAMLADIEKSTVSASTKKLEPMQDIPETSHKPEAAGEPAAASSKGKGKKGKAAPPPMPGQGEVPPAPDATPPPAAAPSKGKSKGPPLPGSDAAEEPAAAPAAAPAPAKGKSKGPPMPGKGGEETTEAPAPSSKGPAMPGKGKDPPGKDGPPMPGKGKDAKGGPPAPGKGKDGPPAKGKDGKGKSKGKSSEAPEAVKGQKPPEELQPKKFHWSNIIGNRFATSMFADIVDSIVADADVEKGEAPSVVPPKMRKIKLDIPALTNNFFQKKKEDTGEDAQSKPSAKKKIATCLEANLSQGVEIFLNGNSIKMEHVKRSIVELDETAMNAELIGKVIAFYPTGEVLKTLEDFRSNNDPSELPYGRAEEFLLDLLDIPNLVPRATCIQTKGMFKAEYQTIADEMVQLKTCLAGLVTSSALVTIFTLVVQVGNYLNYGTNKGAQKGFTLDTLPLLMRVEGFTDKTYSLMRFLMDQLESDHEVRAEAFEEMKLCEAVSKLDFDESCRNMVALRTKIDDVAKCMTEDGGKPISSEDKFQLEMTEFVGSAQGKLDELKAISEDITDLSKRCLDRYAEKAKGKIEETLVKFAQFKKDMEEARRQNLIAKNKKEQVKRKQMEKEKREKKPKDKDHVKAVPAKVPAMKTMKLDIPDAHKTTFSKIKAKNDEQKIGGQNKVRETAGGLVLPGMGEMPLSGRATMAPIPLAQMRASMTPNMPKTGLQVSPTGRISVGVVNSKKGVQQVDIQSVLMEFRARNNV